MKTSRHICKFCQLEFETGWALGGHLQLHRKTFEQLKSPGCQKARLIIERGHKCEVCMNSTWMQKPVPLQLEHIDGNPNNCDKINLQLICPNCHAQTDTYCGKNIGRQKCREREKSQYPNYRSEDYVKAQLS